MFNPTYLRRSRHGLYYFRIAIPERLRPWARGQREIKKSLLTRELRVARRLARIFANHAELCLKKAEALRMNGFSPDEEDAGFGLIFNYNPKSGELRVESDPNNPKDGEHAIEAIRQIAPLLRQEQQSELIRLNQLQQSAECVGRRLSAIVEDFITLNRAKWVPKTAQDYKATLKLFIKEVGDIPAHQVSRQTVHEFKMKMAKAMKIRTLDKKIMTLNTFFNHAISAGDYRGENPASNHKVLTRGEKKKLVSYRPFTPEELKTVFDPINYLSHNSKPNQFWAPLIALYSGARISEICQLMLPDIRKVDENWCFDIKEDAGDRGEEKRTLKTRASARLIPVHPALIQLGILDYVQDVREEAGEQALLFPYLMNTVNGYGKTTGAHFGKYLDNLGLSDPTLVFHSFRSTVNNCLKHAGVDEEKRCQLVGHEHDTINSGTYSTPYNAKFLLTEVIPRLVFPHLDLEALRYQSPQFRPKLKAEMQRRARTDKHLAAKKGIPWGF